MSATDEDEVKMNADKMAREKESTDDLNNNANDPPMSPVSPIPRSVSQISQRPPSSHSQRSVSGLEGSAVSRRSSPTNRPGSVKSGLSRDSGSAISFVTNSASKKSRVKSSLSIDETNKHQVTFTVTIAAAVPAVYDDDSDKNKSKRVVSDPKPQAFYHVEYFLLPTDVDPSKTDITLFGIAAKIYPEKQEAKVMKTWTEGSKTWIAWAHSHVINITSELLKKLCYHKIVVRIWDTREKFGPKAKFDRPRAFKFPPPKPGEDLDDISGVKTIINRLCKSFVRRLPKHSNERTLPQPCVNESSKKNKLADSEFTQNAGLPGTQAHPQTYDASDIPCLLLGHPDIEYKIYSKLVELAKLETQQPDRKMFKRALETEHSVSQENLNQEEKTTKSPTRKSKKGLSSLPPFNEQDPFGTNKPPKGQKSTTPASKVRRHPRDKKIEQLTKEAVEYAKKHGVCSLHIPVGPLFVGQRMCVARLENPVKGVLDAFASVSIDKDLLTKDMKNELNPMSIKLKSVKSLPNEPISYANLREQCHPCSLSYQFFQHAVHQTKSLKQAKNLYWDDLNVVLLGPLPKSLLVEYLLGPPMEVQIHDRDKIPGTNQAPPALFGNDGEDEKINNVGFISGRRTQYNALKERPASWDPYGIAKVNMSGLLLGEKIIHLQVPVHNCPMPDILGRQADSGRVIGIHGSVDGPSQPPMPPGQYLEAQTFIKVRLEVAVPLVTPEEVAKKPYIPKTVECPFGRIVYILDKKMKGVASDILNITSEINAKGLGLDKLSPVVLNAALSTYKLSAEQQASKDLDIVTGFQLMDGRYYIFILEGIKDLAIKHIWDSVTKPCEGVKILYNSDLTFSDRMYGTLDVDLTRVKLHEPLNMIVQQPLLFVRDLVPKSCFTALTRLDEMTHSPDLRAAVRNNLFPSAEQVISMSREFGIPLTADDIITDAERLATEEAMHSQQKSKSAVPLDATARSSRSRMKLKDPLDMANPRYLEVLKSRQLTAGDMDYVNDNIENESEQVPQVLTPPPESQRTVMLESRHNKARKPFKPTQQSGEIVAHNYSTHTFNSTERAKDMIRQTLDKDTLYTYNPEFHHSATFVPVNVERLLRDEKIAHRQKFVAKKDWSYPGVKPVVYCNIHPRKPDPARIDALKEEWEENLNHNNKLKPTLEQREIYPWIDRKQDMDTWTYPAKHFEPQPEPPISIMLPGAQLKAEKDEAAAVNHELWSSKLVVEDTQMHFYRCNPQTEAIQSGLKASNELSKLENLRRDPPKKYAFSKMKSDIPPLRVVHYPGVDTKARSNGVDVDALNASVMPYEKAEPFHPGPFNKRSWSVESNRIPAPLYKHAENGYFNVYHNTEHTNSLYKRQIVPLSEEEYKSTYLFADPNEADRSRQRLGALKLAQSMQNSRSRQEIEPTVI